MTAIKNTATEIRENIFETLSVVAGTLSSIARLKLVHLLAQSPKGVEQLAQEIGESVANTSQHLQRLARADLVRVERRGVARVYSLTSPKVAEVWEQIQELGHELAPQLDEQEARLTDQTLWAPLSVKEVLREVASGQAVLIDAREAGESDHTPVSGALPILGFRASRQTKKTPIYVFCRGRYCAMATDVVRRLRHEGFRAFRLRESPTRLRLILNQPEEKTKGRKK